MSFTDDPWTPPEVKTLRTLYESAQKKGFRLRDPKCSFQAFLENAATLLKRSVGSVAAKAFALGMRANVRWTREDDELLTREINRISMRLLRKKLRRSRVAILQRAAVLGLLGVPQGYITLTAAAKKAGYSRRGLHLILTKPCYEEIVKLWRPRRMEKRTGHYYVEWDAVHEVLKLHLAKEHLSHAAARLGVEPERLREYLVREGVKHYGKTQHFFEAPEVYDAVVKKHHPETLLQAQRRLRVPLRTLRRALAATGVTPGIGQRYRLKPGQADEAVAALKAREAVVETTVDAMVRLKFSPTTMQRLTTWARERGLLTVPPGKKVVLLPAEWDALWSSYREWQHGGETIYAASRRLGVTASKLSRACAAAGVSANPETGNYRLAPQQAEQVLAAYEQIKVR